MMAGANTVTLAWWELVGGQPARRQEARLSPAPSSWHLGQDLTGFGTNILLANTQLVPERVPGCGLQSPFSTGREPGSSSWPCTPGLQPLCQQDDKWDVATESNLLGLFLRNRAWSWSQTSLPQHWRLLVFHPSARAPATHPSSGCYRPSLSMKF